MTTTATRSRHASDLHVEIWGAGTPVVLVHGSLARRRGVGTPQRSLADDGFRLSVVDRRGYGQSPIADGEDFLVDAADIADLWATARTSWGTPMAASA